MGMILRFTGHTDVGREREHNEDSFGLLNDFNLFLVADGMGGHRAGDVASQMAIESVNTFFTATSKEDITWPFQFDPNLPFSLNRLTTAVLVANNKIFQESMRNSEHQGMGTTVVAVHFVENNQVCHISHVGDSRCYRIRDNKIELLTKDHSLVNDYLKAAPDLTEEQLADLPTNVITRALGMQDSVQVDVQTQTTEVGDLHLLCSDGLSGMLSDAEILDIVQANRADIGKISQGLIDRANFNGGEDNITVVLVEVAANEEE